jgi:bacterioferritin-associated ferredoxin
MYVCVCHAVTDSDIRELVNRGASSLMQVQASIPVASCCGRCEPTAQDVIDQELAARSRQAAA